MKFFVFLFLLQLGYGVIKALVADVILIGGQSNATGQGRVANLPVSFIPDKEVLIFYSQYLNCGGDAMCWQPLCPASESKDRFGVELSLGTTLHKLYPEHKIVLIKHASSGTNLYKQWNPGNRGGEKTGEEFLKFIETVRAGFEDLRQQGYTPVVRAMVWQQGEADARDVAEEKNHKAYADNLRNFILQVRKTFDSEHMPFIYGEVLPMSAGRFPGRELIKQAQHQVAEISGTELSVKKAILVKADDLQMLKFDYNTPYPEDDVHLGTFGILTLGDRFAKAIYECGGVK